MLGYTNQVLYLFKDDSDRRIKVDEGIEIEIIQMGLQYSLVKFTNGILRDYRRILDNKCIDI